MPPQAGFRYTPSSYLLRTRDENRPWTATDEDGSLDGELEMAMRQEERPTRKGTSIDQHFQNRVNRRKQAYRSIIKGEVDVEADEKPVNIEEVDLLLSDSSSKSSLSASDGDDSPPSPSSSGNAREARQRRLSASTPKDISTGETILSRVEAEKARARNLRGQRLRQSLKASSEEEDAQETMRLRRLQQAERDRLAAEQEELMKKREAEAALEAERRRVELEEERRKLEEERRAFEAAKRRAADELEYKLEQERKREQLKRNQSMERRSLQQQKDYHRRRALDEAITEEEKSMSRRLGQPHSHNGEDDDDNDVTLFEGLQELMRDSGVLGVCVASCFGDERDVMAVDDAEAGDDDIFTGDNEVPVRPYQRKSNEV